MRRALVYSHDTFGLGNIRRMLEISEQMLSRMPELTVLLVTGSPVAHRFVLPKRLDYIKLPCLTRVDRDQYAAKYLSTDLDETLALRSSLLQNAIASFQPDVMLVDKKPGGLCGELLPALRTMRRKQASTQTVLVLRDILDSPEVTSRAWDSSGYHALIEAYYDQVLVLGSPRVFDAPREYAFPTRVRDKVRYTGYLRRPAGRQTRSEARGALGVGDDQPLVLVTPGGGEDGYQLLDAYVRGLELRANPADVHSLIVVGPELPPAQRAELEQRVHGLTSVTLVEFLSDMMGYVSAADAVVSMAGYNTICEIMSAGKPAVVVPRVRPVAEQWIRAERMAQLGLLEVIHPDELTPEKLLATVRQQLVAQPVRSATSLFDNTEWVTSLLERPAPVSFAAAALNRFLPSRGLAAAG